MNILPRKRVVLSSASLFLLSVPEILAQGQPGVPLWKQTVCMSVVTALGLTVLPPEMVIDLVRRKVEGGRSEAKRDGS